MTDVTVSVTGGTATAGDDFAAVDDVTVTIAAGEASGTGTFTLAPVNDDVDEADETVTVSGTTTSDLTVTPTAGLTVTITDDDERGVRATPHELTVREGDTATYEVKLTSQPTADVTVTVTASGDATVDPGTLSFTTEDWSTAQTVTVTGKEDADSAAGEASIAHVANGGDYEDVAGDTVDVTVTDDDQPATQIALELDPGTVPEGAGVTAITVTARLSPDAQAVPTEVTVSVTGDTATAGTDYAAVAPVTLTIAAGQTTGTASFTLTPVDDAVDEADETLAVSGVTAAPELPVTPATLTLGDDDERGVTVKPTLLRLRAGEHKSYTVRLSSQPTETATVRVIVPPDRAADLTVEPATLTYTAATWQTPQTVTVTAVADSDAAASGTRLELRHAVSGGDYDQLRAQPVAVSITGDGTDGDPPEEDDPPDEEPPADGPPTVSIAAAAPAVEEGAPARFTLTRTGAATDPRTVAVTVTERGRFIAGKPPAEVTFAANARTAALLVPTVDDATDEPDGAVTATLAAGAGYVTAEPVAATVTVTDNDAAPEITIADARVPESGGTIEFTVRMAAASGHRVTVTCVSEDGTAQAGKDYVAELGVLALEPGQTSGAIRVAVLDDTLEESDETFTMVLSDPAHATLADATATGTIEDDDGSVAQAWLSRFGRTVATHVLDAVDGRLREDARPGGQTTLAGRRLEAAADLERSDSIEQIPFRTMEFRELLAGSSFQVPLLAAEAEVDESAAGGGAGWTAWGRGGTTQLAGVEGDLTVGGSVASGVVGADYDWGQLLTGVSVAYSAGGGEYTVRGTGNRKERTGDLKSWLLSAHPYARLHLTDRLAVWGLVGYGLGQMSLAEGGANETIERDVALLMGAFGGRGVLVSGAESGGVGLTVKSDGFLLQVSAAAADELPAVTADVSRVRLVLEGSVDVLRGPAGVLTPSLQVGGRYDGGAAETGVGLEVGGGLRYAYPAWGLTLAANGRLLLAHQDRDYEEWGAGGSLRLAPGAAGRGPSLSLNTSWGDASSGVEQLWSQGAGRAPGLAVEAATAPAGRLAAELSYGIGVAGGAGSVTPYAGVALGEGGERSYRLGGRFTLGQSFSLSLEGNRRARPGHDTAPVHGLTLGGTLRW